MKRPLPSLKEFLTSFIGSFIALWIITLTICGLVLASLWMLDRFLDLFRG